MNNINKMEETRENANIAKNKFIKDMVSLGGDKNIISFIANIRYHAEAIHVSLNDSCEAIRSLFENGYCYYFAKMLEDAFPGGEVCITAPIGHIVYAYNDIMYDISGISDAEYVVLIPIKELDKRYYAGFMHIPEYKDDLTFNDVRDLTNEYVSESKGIHAKGYNECRALLNKE